MALESHARAIARARSNAHGRCRRLACDRPNANRHRTRSSLRHASSSDDALERARDARGRVARGALWGRGTHLGLPANFVLRWRDDAFVEENMNAELCYANGRARGRRGACWEEDFSGYAQRLELDDAEALTLSAWTRTGYWASASCVEEYLDLEVCDGGDGDVIEITMKMKGGRVRAKLTLDGGTALPKRLAIAVCGDEDVWEFEDWCRDSEGAAYARRTVLRGTNGGTQEFYVTGATSGWSNEGWEIFDKPNEKPRTVIVDAMASSNVPTVRASSSHVLVEPIINGKNVGPFILDTGASGLVVTPRAAKRLGLRAFGEVHVSGVSGRVPCQFRRGEDLKLGPLTLLRPVFMEMGLDGIVSGSKKPVAGIIGFDAFKNAILSVSAGGERVDLYAADQIDVIDENWAWQELRLVSNVPHISATFSGVSDDHKTKPNIFMIDSGAGGADVIFHSKAVEELGLAALLGPEGDRVSSRVRGVSGANGESAGATMTFRTSMDWLELVSAGSDGANVRFEKIDTLLASGPGFSLSEHSCGMICARLLGTKRIVYDVPRRRIAFVD